MSSASSQEKLNLSEQVLRYISQQVKSGALQKGDRLPTNRELVKVLGVSTLTIQRVMKQLESQGVVSCRRRHGTFLEDPDAIYCPKVKSDLIGLFAPEICADFHFDMLTELERSMMSEGKLLSINFTHSDAEREVMLLRSLARHRLEALVYFTSPRVLSSPSHSRTVTKLVNRYIDEGTFVLFADICPPGFEERLISLDNEKATQMLTNKLIQQGHHKIAYIGASFQHDDQNCSSEKPVFITTEKARFAGYKRALDQAGLVDEWFIDIQVLEGDDWIDRIEQNIRQFLKKHSDITGFTVTNQQAALVLRKILGERTDLLFPVEESIASLFEANVPPFESLAWIQIPGAEMGRVAHEILLDDYPANYEPGHVKIRPSFWKTHG